MVLHFAILYIPFFTVGVVSGAAYSFLIIRTGNIRYYTFKLGGMESRSLFQRTCNCNRRGAQVYLGKQYLSFWPVI
jgi:hypothetical protein